ncbi:hypothetical protein AB1Y20_002281 [Prymnesium parvum]|uniref:Protein kinase domain-containing protein n=1 Tax=Prymnesium parvum TaxID=97485 RepID=A0AB34JAU3_PRYPA
MRRSGALLARAARLQIPSRRWLSASAGRRGGVPQQVFAAGVASAALAGFGIGVVGPALYPDEPHPHRSGNAAGEEGRHRMIVDSTLGEMERTYKLITALAHGGTATVWRAIERSTGCVVAIKVVNKALVNVSTISREIDAMERCSGAPNVAGLLAVYDVDGDDINPDGEWRLVMELADGGELLEWVLRHPLYTEKVASALMKQAVQAIQHLHRCGIMHRDVKPENLVLSSTSGDACLKLVDFGAAASFERGTVDGKAGTWTYWAPEQAKRQAHDQAVDIWALGVVLFILLSGRHPFQRIVDGGLDDKSTLEAIVKGHFCFDDDEWSNVSASARDLVQRLLVYDPRQRLTADQILDHPWIRGDEVPEQPLAWWSNTRTTYQRLMAKLAFW